MTDVELMTRAIEKRLVSEDERRSLDVHALDDGRRLEIRLGAEVVQVRPMALEHTRTRDEWDITAGGVLERLRNKHSMAPKVTYTLEDVYHEINRVLLSIFRDALSAEEYATFMAEMLTADIVAIRDAASQLRAMNQKIRGELVQVVGGRFHERAEHDPPAVEPWTVDSIMRNRR